MAPDQTAIRNAISDGDLLDTFVHRSDYRAATNQGARKQTAGVFEDDATDVVRRPPMPYREEQDLLKPDCSLQTTISGDGLPHLQRPIAREQFGPAAL